MEPEPAVDGNYALDPTNNRWIPYKTWSDALIAQLSLSHGFSISEVNLVLGVIRDPSFKCDQVTFHDAGDIYDAVADERLVAREKAAQSRSGNCTWDRTAGVPRLVLDLVIQCIAMMCPCCMDDRDVIWQQTMGNMALVHRSWTAPAQNILQRRIFARDDSERDLQILHSVHCGPWTRSLVYRIPGQIVASQWFLPPLLPRIPNLRHLRLKIMGDGNSVYEPSQKLIRDVLEAIGRLERLVRLVVDAMAVPDLLASLVCLQLPKLVNLTCLCLADWGGGGDVTPLPHSSPPPRLKTITFGKTFGLREDAIPKDILAWLLRPSGEYALENLLFSYRRPDDLHILSDTLSDAPMYGLRKLQIREDEPDIHDVHDVLQSIFTHLPDLNTLQLQCPSDKLTRLPNSLEELAVSCEYCEDPADMRQVVTGLVSSNGDCHRNLRKLVLLVEMDGLQSASSDYRDAVSTCGDREVLFEEASSYDIAAFVRDCHGVCH